MSTMSKGTLKSPNDSVLQSTTLPSTRSYERSSLEDGSFGSRSLFGGVTAQVGGGSFNSYLADHMARLHEDIRLTTRKLELEQRRLFKVDKDLKAAENDIGEKRTKFKMSQRAQDDAVASKVNEVRQLERHLEKAIADLNQGAADNEHLREEIDQLRKERKILNTVFKQLERGINRSGKALTELMTQINSDRLMIDEAKQKSQALNKMLERERRDFHKDCEGRRKAVTEEASVQREQERCERERGKEAGGKRRVYMIADEEEAFSESAVKRRILKLSFLNTIQRRHIKQHQKNIEVFEQAFATIKSSTGISDIEEIVKIFIGLEQRNFSLLTYVNQLNREIETIEIRNKELQSQLNGHKTRQTQSSEKRELALSEITSQIAQTRTATKEKNVMSDDSSLILEDVRPMIWSIVKFLRRELPKLVNVGYEGDAPPMKMSPPDEQEENLSNYLMYIEEALMQFRICLSAQSLTMQPPPGKSAGIKRPTDLPTMHGAGDDSDDEDMGMSERMYTRGELREKAQAMIQRRRKKPGQQGKHSEGMRAEPTEEGGLSDRAAEITARKDIQAPKDYSNGSGVAKDS